MHLFKRTVSDAEMNYIYQGGYVLTGVCLFFGWLFCQQDYTRTQERNSSPQIFLLYLTWRLRAIFEHFQ